MFAWIARVPQQLLMLLVKGYRLFFRAWLGNVCRFTPTCSAYSLQALQDHGAVGGTYLTLRRLARCHPWCRGGHDPVPPAGRGLFTRFTTAEAADPAAGSTDSRFTLPEKTRT